MIFVIFFCVLSCNADLEVFPLDNFVVDTSETNTLNVKIPSTVFYSDEGGFTTMTVTSDMPSWMTSSMEESKIINEFIPFLTESLKLEGDYVYLCDAHYGIFIYNVAVKTNPTLVSEILYGSCGDLALEGDYIYATQYFDGVIIIDKSDVNNPFIVTQTTEYYSTKSIFISNGIVFTCQYYGGVNIFNVTDKSQPPVFLKNIYFSNHLCSDLNVNENLLYVAARQDGIEVYEVSSPKYPIYIGNIETDECRNIYIDPATENGYIGDYHTLKVMDLSQPISTTLFLEIDDYIYDCRKVIPIGEYLLVADRYYGLKVAWVDPPGVIRTHQTNGRLNTFEMDDDGYIYCQTGFDILTIFDGSNILDIIEVFTFTDDSLVSSVDSIHVYNTPDRSHMYVYFQDLDQADFYVFEVFTEEGRKPEFIKKIEGIYSLNQKLIDGILYLNIFSSLSFYDLTSDPEDPQLIYSFDTHVGGYAFDLEISNDGVLIFLEGDWIIHIYEMLSNGSVILNSVTDFTDDIVDSPYGYQLVYADNLLFILDTAYDYIHVIDVTDMFNPFFLSSLYVDNLVSAGYSPYKPNILYAACNNEMYAIDIEDGLNLKIAGGPFGRIDDTYYQTRGEIMFRDDQYFIVQIPEGFVIFDYKMNVTHPEFVSRTEPENEFNFNGYTRGVGFLDNNHVVTASDETGIRVYRILDLTINGVLEAEDYHISCGSVEVEITGKDSSDSTNSVTFNIDFVDLCPPYGSCVDEFYNCSCISELYYGHTCDNYMCWEYESDSNYACNENGDCVGANNCNCTTAGYMGEECEYWSCYGITYLENDVVCAGNGRCVEKDICQCDPGYSSVNPFGPCTEYYCGVEFRDSDLVCNGHGTCEASHECDCDHGYKGDLCEQWECGGYDNDEESVCNKKGTCISPEVCDCNRNWGGERCTTNRLLGSVMAPILLIFFWSCFCCCFVIVCWAVIMGGMFIFLFLLTLISGLLAAGGYGVKQQLGLERFSKLKNFDLLLKEQELEEDDSIAHLRIDQKLFVIPFEEIKTERIIGEGGSSSVVFKSRWLGREVAFKCFKTRMVCTNQDIFDEFEREVKVMANLSHPNVIRFFGATLKPPRVGIVMEFCENGELLYFFKCHREKNESGEMYPLEEKVRMIMEISSSLKYLHSRNVIHRDLKSENILVDEKEQTKLMDFGLSKLSQNLAQEKTTRVGTCVYMAPEVLLSSDYDEKCDVFSFGILIWVMITENQKPYGKNEERVEFKVAQNPNFRPNVEDVEDIIEAETTSKRTRRFYSFLVELMKSSWHANPKRRSGFNEIYSNLERKMKIILEFINEDEEVIMKAINKEIEYEEKIGGRIRREGEAEDKKFPFLTFSDPREMVKGDEDWNRLKHENKKLKTEIERYSLLRNKYDEVDETELKDLDEEIEGLDTQILEYKKKAEKPQRELPQFRRKVNQQEEEEKRKKEEEEEKKKKKEEEEEKKEREKKEKEKREREKKEKEKKEREKKEKEKKEKEKKEKEKKEKEKKEKEKKEKEKKEKEKKERKEREKREKEKKEKEKKEKKEKERKEKEKKEKERKEKEKKEEEEEKKKKNQQQQQIPVKKALPSLPPLPPQQQQQQKKPGKKLPTRKKNISLSLRTGERKRLPQRRKIMKKEDEGEEKKNNNNIGTTTSMSLRPMAPKRRNVSKIKEEEKEKPKKKILFIKEKKDKVGNKNKEEKEKPLSTKVKKKVIEM